jgi:hypothetical protein
VILQLRLSLSGSRPCARKRRRGEGQRGLRGRWSRERDEGKIERGGLCMTNRGEERKKEKEEKNGEGEWAASSMRERGRKKERRKEKKRKRKRRGKIRWDTWQAISRWKEMMKSTLSNPVMPRGQDKIFFYLKPQTYVKCGRTPFY